MKENDSNEISERAKRAYQRNKKLPTRSGRPELTHEQKLEFLSLVAQLASPVIFKRKLNLNANDIEFYKKQLKVESQDEARRMRIRLERNITVDREAEIAESIRQQRAAEKLAQQRLEELEQKRAERALAARKPKRDPLTVKLEDAERQRRFNKQEVAALPKSKWRLPLERHRSETDQIEQFRRDLQYRGVSFCKSRYGVKLADLKAEAARLGLKINWETIKR